MNGQQRIGAAADLPPGTVVGVGHYAVGNAAGQYFAVTRRCRHFGADLAAGTIDAKGCLVCPWHRSAYDVTTGRMVRGPQGIFARVPGLDLAYLMLTRVLPLGRAAVTERGGELYLGGRQVRPDPADPATPDQAGREASERLTEPRSTDMTETAEPPGPESPGPEQQVSFAAHVRPLFREQDLQAMNWAFDLSSYDDVRTHADTILGRLAGGGMPCDGAWPADRVEVFRRWVQTGTQP